MWCRTTHISSSRCQALAESLRSMETPNALSEQRSTRRPSRRKYKVASQGNSPVRLLNVRTPSSAHEVTYNKTVWHVPSKHSSAAPTPALARLRNQYHAYIITHWKYHGHRGRGTTTARPKCGSTALGAPDFVIFSYFQDSTLRKAYPAVQSPNTRCNSQGGSKLRRMSRWSL